MKKIGVLHRELAAEIASLGHGDMIVIADSGLPVPKGVKCIDLALCQGTPPFIIVLNTVLTEMVVEKAIVAKELSGNSKFIEQIKQNFDHKLELEQVTHEQLKEISKEARAVVRTGEWTPYANIVLKSGVAF